MKKAYPITLQRDGEFYVVYVPDFEINTQGTSIADAIDMARDAISLCACTRQDENMSIPEPSALNAVDKGSAEIVTLVDVDFDEYRKRYLTRTVRKNVSLPAWLNDEAEREGINFSAVLQNALKAELHMTDNR